MSDIISRIKSPSDLVEMQGAKLWFTESLELVKQLFVRPFQERPLL